VQNGDARAGIGYFAAVLGFCLPSFLFVLSEMSRGIGGDLGEIVRAAAFLVLALASPPMTGVACCVALWATFRRGVDAFLKFLIWLTVLLSILAVAHLTSRVARIGV
jgi:hypothetical protein